MKIIRKSIIRKLIFELILFCILIGSVFFYFYYTKVEVVPYYILLAGLGFFLLMFLLIYWFDVIRPLRKILVQMQALLTGKPYKRIFTDRIDEIGVIANFFNKVTEGFGEVSVDLKDRERMHGELSIAAELQREILPLQNPNLPGLQIVAKNKAATEVGGDSFDMITSKNRTYIYLGDVTGHGVAAGLIMTMVNSLIRVFADVYDTTYDIVVSTNRYIKKHVKKSMFMTMVMFCWDHEKKKMTYVGAGHEHILLYKVGSGECQGILSGGIALGMVPDNSKLVKETSIDLGEGDFIVLYSDGIIEAKNEAGEMFGLERLKSAVREYAAQYSADGVNFHIAKDVSEYIKNHAQEDDMTLIVMKRDSKISPVSDKQFQTTTW